jgi:Zn-dependent protease with chaperone function
MRFPALALSLLLSGCVAATAPMAVLPAGVPAPAAQAGQGFDAVVARMKPVAEHVCRERAPQLNCIFVIEVENRPGQAPNAWHRRDAQGRPIIGFNTALLAYARNDHELALIFGHEAAHHIANHLTRARASAQTGALVGGLLGIALGADQGTVQGLVDLGAGIGARRYSQPFELEADRLGTLIAWRAGYDPALGAGLFRRLPDPGNTFLGTHPPNSERLRVISQTLADVQAGRPI